MKKWLILLILLIAGALFVPAVSAVEKDVNALPYLDSQNHQSFDYYETAFSLDAQSQAGATSQFLVSLSKVQFYTNVHYFMFETNKDMFPEGDSVIWYQRPSDNTYHTGTMKVTKSRNVLGAVTKTVVYVFPLDWEVGSKIGAWTSPIYADNNGVKASTPYYYKQTTTMQYSYKWTRTKAAGNDDYAGYMGFQYMATSTFPGGFTQHSHVEGYTNIRYTLDIDEYGMSYIIGLKRVISGVPSPSTITIKDNEDAVIFSDSASLDREILIAKDKGKSIEIVTGTISTLYNLNIGGGSTTPGDANYTVTVYAQNADTGALINSVALGCKNAETSEWTNSTIDGGWTVIELPAGNYEFHGTATGFYQPAPGRLTVDGVGDNLALLLYPVGGTPPAGNVTLQVWCNYGVLGDGNRYGVPGAEVSIVGIVGEGIGYSSGILTANEQGFVTVEAPGNTSYSAYGSKIGYISGETEFSVLTGSPVHVSISLTPGAVPTEPPITPTPTVTPTPTETPVPGGFMDDAGNGIAQLFGVSLAVGKMLLGFLIALAVGMGTAKQLEGGAPEFVVGFTGAAFLSTVAGLIPIGFFVLVAVLAGIYLGKSYIGGGEGGR